jgi:hypothetical protein
VTEAEKSKVLADISQTREMLEIVLANLKAAESFPLHDKVLLLPGISEMLVQSAVNLTRFSVELRTIARMEGKL